MSPRKLAGALKAAMLIRSLDKETANSVLGRLGQADRAKVAKLLPQVDSIAPDLIEQVAQEFTASVKPFERPKIKSDDVASPLAGKGSTQIDLKAAEEIEPEHLIQLIKDEHPQTIALIIAQQPPQRGGRILNNLPQEMKAEVSMRIAGLDTVVPSMASEINQHLAEKLREEIDTPVQAVGGKGYLAKILNQIEGETVEFIMEQIEDSSSDLADEVKAMMFVFEDLVLVDDKGMQKALRNIETRDLALALKAAPEEVKMKIFSNMSERATEMLKEEIDSTGAVRMKEVTDAQRNITKLIKDMETQGEVIIEGRGGEEYVG
jgi:flagellar motor switch protein FliG